MKFSSPGGVLKESFHVDHNRPDQPAVKINLELNFLLNYTEIFFYFSPSKKSKKITLLPLAILSSVTESYTVQSQCVKSNFKIPISKYTYILLALDEPSTFHTPIFNKIHSF